MIRAILVLTLCAAQLCSQSLSSAHADEASSMLAALSPYNVLVEAAYGGEKVKLAGLVIQRDIVPGYNKDADSTRFYILVSLSRIPDCFLQPYSYTVWQDRFDSDKRTQLGAKSVSAVLHLANAKANLGILRCDSLPYFGKKADATLLKQDSPGRADAEALKSRSYFTLTSPTGIDFDKKLLYKLNRAYYKEFSIGAMVVLRGNTAFEIKGLSPLITGDASFAAGVPLFYIDNHRYFIAGLINFERYAPDLHSDVSGIGELYSSTAYYYPVEYIRRAISLALPPSKDLDLPAHYKGMRASGAKVIAISNDATLQANDEITAIDGVPFDRKWGISASLYIALNYSGGNRLCSIKYERPGIKGEQAIAEVELQSSNSLWFGIDTVPLPPKLKDEIYKRADNGFFVRSTDGGCKYITVGDLIVAARIDKDRTRFDRRFQQSCPRLDMWLWDNFAPNDCFGVDYFRASESTNLYVERLLLKEWRGYHDTFSRETKPTVTSVTPPQPQPAAQYDEAIKAANNAIKDLNDAIAKVTETPPAESDLDKALMSAKDLKAKLQGYLNALNSTTATAEQKLLAQANVCIDIIKVKDCIRTLELARTEQQDGNERVQPLEPLERTNTALIRIGRLIPTNRITTGRAVASTLPVTLWCAINGRKCIRKAATA